MYKIIKVFETTQKKTKYKQKQTNKSKYITIRKKMITDLRKDQLKKIKFALKNGSINTKKVIIKKTVQKHCLNLKSLFLQLKINQKQQFSSQLTPKNPPHRWILCLL